MCFTRAHVIGLSRRLHPGDWAINVCVNEQLPRIRAMVAIYYSSDLAGRLGQYQSTSSRRHLRTLERYIELCKWVLEMRSYSQVRSKSERYFQYQQQPA